MRYWFTVVLLILAGCQMPGRDAATVVTAQTGATVEGSGSKMTTPVNAAQPSSQKATKRTYTPVWNPNAPLPNYFAYGDYHGYIPVSSLFEPGTVPAVPDDLKVNIYIPDPSYDWRVVNGSPAPRGLAYKVEEESTETNIGAHQDAKGITQVAFEYAAKKITSTHILGGLFAFIGLIGMIHAVGNKETGYPTVFIGFLVVGIITTMTGNPLLLWISVLPGLLYVGQKFGFIRIPAP